MQEKTNINTNIKNNINDFIVKKNNNYRNIEILNKENRSHSLDNTYFPLNKKSLRKNETNSKNEYYLKDFYSNQIPNISYPLNKSYSKITNYNDNYKENIDIKNNINVNYKTIKIKKFIKKSINDKIIDEKSRIDKIKANLLFKKNITYNSLLSQNEANGFNKSNIINNQ